MLQFKTEHLIVFRTVPLASLAKEDIQLVPEGTWLQLKPEHSSQLQLSLYKLGPTRKSQENLQLSFCSEKSLNDTKSYLLYPGQFFQLKNLGADITGVAKFSTIPNLYFNKKFNHDNGLGQPHSEVSYFKSYYIQLHPQLGLRPLQILDLGCGRGRNSVIFAGDKNQEYKVMGIDKNINSLKTLENMSKAENLEKKLIVQQVDLNTWREAPAHDITMAIVSLQFLQADASPALLSHCMERASSGALHLLVFPIASENPKIIWPSSFHFLPHSDQVKYLYMQQGWTILEYRESYGHLGKVAEDGLPIRGIFATLITQKI